MATVFGSTKFVIPPTTIATAPAAVPGVAPVLFGPWAPGQVFPYAPPIPVAPLAPPFPALPAGTPPFGPVPFGKFPPTQFGGLSYAVPTTTIVTGPSVI